ncbi:hypothetical protein AMTRI_Chr07g76110 [Amborella trichopoda]|uniref:actin-related protein 2/3 complex subunit 2B n=1 Tax=Amborella trichopoda TaxID=13333 RepID=UPI0009BDB757|nr:actin-related protein 2/3 complex subunit 2B [Amborella trichopoda]|eukprot:XP_020531059.1 actin-related protein 2/3 complex subunit 2B [Amborella trichopoda]
MENTNFFQRPSPALMEILLDRMKNIDKAQAIDHHISEFGDVRYHIQDSAQDQNSIYLSISAPSLSPNHFLRNGLPRGTAQTIERIYGGVAEIFEPPKEGFQLTIRIDFSKLPLAEEDRIKVGTEICSLRAVLLGSQLKEMLWTLCSQDDVHGGYKPIKLMYHPGEPFFVIRLPDKITSVFPMRFKDDSDVVLATAFFQELMDLRCSSSWDKAPTCTWSPIPPIELRGEPLHELSTNGGFVSFDILSRHIEGPKLEKTVWSLLNFSAYVKYHIKCSRGFMQRSMRKRLESLAEVMQKAKITRDDKKQVQGCGCMRRLLNASKTKVNRTNCGQFLQKIKRVRLRIRIRGFSRFQRRWLKIPKFHSSIKYSKLD